MSDRDRIANLEEIIRSLARRVSHLEQNLGNPPAVSDEHDSDHYRQRSLRTAKGESGMSQSAPTVNLEALIGRYGTLALATVTILAAVGSFLAWSISHGLFGPWMRIVLGVLTAVALAAIGWRLRRLGERRFGNILLSLSLATLHVVAWALGPGLSLVPFGVALAVGAVASATLCTFAISESDDDLLAVGFGGAYFAPFVSGDGTQRPDMWFAAYGALVFATGVFATNGRTSRMTFRVVSAGLILFALTLLFAPDVNGNPSLLAPFFTLTASVVVTVIGTRVAWRGFLRTTLVASAAISLAIAARYTSDLPQTNWPQLLATVIAGFIIWASTFAFPTERSAVESIEGPEPSFALLDYGALPVLLLLAGTTSLPPQSNAKAAALCTLWAAVTCWLAHRTRDDKIFDFLAAATSVELVAAPLALWWDRPALCIPALATIAAASGYAATRFRPKVPLAASVAICAAAFIWALDWLSSLAPFTSLPFSTGRSLAIGTTVAAAFLILRWNRARLNEFAVASPWIAAFLWGTVELGRAISPDVSAFLLVAYFAATGVAVLSSGTKRQKPRLRQIGLGLAVIAGLKSLFEAGHSQSIIAKLGIYLVAGGYLMIVAYIYRRAQPSRTGLS